LFLHRQGLAGRPSDEDQPDLPVAGLQSALGSLPSVALSSAEANGSKDDQPYVDRVACLIAGLWQDRDK
jgi:hypothetical protein